MVIKKDPKSGKKYHSSRNFSTAWSTRNKLYEQFHRAILLELYKKETDSGLFPIHCYTDNKSLLDLVHSTKTLKEKRLKVDV